jgi:cytoskeletal protein RodZ
MLRGAAALGVIGLILLLFTRDIGDVDVVSTASTTTTTTSSSTSTSTSTTSTSTSTSSSTSTSTTSTTVAPVGPPTTGVRPPVTAPPPVETTTTTTTVQSPAPTIVRFTVRNAFSVTVVCRTGFGREAVWFTQNADSVSLVTPLQTLDDLSPGGSQIFCAGPLETVTLIATGPGGTASATAQTPDDLI